MTAPDDFARVADLLGDFYEKAASPASPGLGPDGPRAPRGVRAAGAASPGPRSSQTRPGAEVHVSRLLAKVWPEIAGAEVAANATPVHLRAGRLVVSTASSVWAHTLQYLSEDLIVRLNEHLGAGAVRQIVFRHAGWEERQPVDSVTVAAADTIQGMTPAPLSAEQNAALAAVEELDLPPAMRQKILSAMTASFVRAQRAPVR